MKLKIHLLACIAALFLPVVSQASSIESWIKNSGLDAYQRPSSRNAENEAEKANLPAGVGFDKCKHLFPGGRPIDLKSIDKKWDPIGLCFTSFAVVYSGLTKTPLIVIEKLNKNILDDASGEERTNVFYPDPRIPKGKRAELSDFESKGLNGEHFDRGHMANAADQPDKITMRQSFALTNMVPQNEYNNRKGPWIKAEKDTRKYVKRAPGNVFVYSGPLFHIDRGTLGANRVWIPSHLFKLVFDETSTRSWAYMMSNTADEAFNPPVSYQKFSELTGWAVLGTPKGTQP